MGKTLNSTQLKALDKLKHVPFALDGRRQNLSDLARTIDNETERFNHLPNTVKFSLLTPMWNTSPVHLEELILSCQAQSYSNWELILQDDGSPKTEHLVIAEQYSAVDDRIKVFKNAKNMGISGGRNEAIKNSSGDFLAILDHDDLLHPQTLGLYYKAINENPDCNFIFSNECKISENSELLKDFFSKPEFDLQTLLRTNYICHFTAIKRSVYEDAKENDLYYISEYDGVEDHEFFLRCALSSKVKAFRIPHYCYYWRISSTSTAGDIANKPGVRELGLKMVTSKAQNIYKDCAFEVRPAAIGTGERLLRFGFRTADNQSKVCVLVPYRDESEMTLKCLESLESQENCGTLSVQLINNGSQRQHQAAIETWMQKARRHSYNVVEYDHPFNYGKMNNYALSTLQEPWEYCLFLNNDVTLTNTQTICHMVNVLGVDDKFAHTSIRLNFTGTQHIQYGGIEFSDALVGSGFYQIRHMLDSQDFVFDDHIQSISGFACCLVKRKAWEDIGKLDEGLFANGFGDVEWCLRAQTKNYEGFYIGSISGEHAESATRKCNAEDAQLSRLHILYGSEIMQVKSKLMSYNKHVAVNSNNLDGHLDFPLRYVVADKLNDTFKKALGPIHKQIKQMTTDRLK